MNITELKELVEQGESEILEFKEKTNTRSLVEAGKTLCSFLNGEGGVVLFGVTNKGEIVGQEVADKTKKDIAEIINELHPFAPIDVEYIAIKDKRQVVYIAVNTTAINPPYYFRKMPYHRSGPTTQLMTPSLQEDLLEAKRWVAKKWEEMPAVDCKLEDIDYNEVSNLVIDGLKEKTIPAGTDPKDVEGVLDSLKLIKGEIISNAAIVLFGKDPSKTYFQCSLKLARFRGKDKREFIDSKIVYGNAFQMLREAMEFCNKHFPVASKVVPYQVQRKTTPFLPDDVIREAMINAISHRDYTVYSGSIYLAIYDDRVEIENEGKLPKELTVKDLKKRHRSYPRNPNILKVFARRGMIESWGRGTQQIVELCLNAGHPEPEFIEDRSGFIVQMFSKYPMQTFIEEETTLNSLSVKQKEIYSLLQNAVDGLPIRVLIEQANLSRTSMKKELEHMQNKGLIYSIGKGRSVMWKIT